MIDKFCMISAPRTGSNYLCGALNSHPRIICHLEVYHRNDIYTWKGLHKQLSSQWQLEDRDQQPVRFFDNLQAKGQELYEDTQITGFKIFGQHNDTMLRHVIDSDAWKIIILGRENLLAQYSSTQISAKTNVFWKARTDTSVDQEEKTLVEFDPSAFRGYMTEIGGYFSGIRESLNASGKPYYELDYTEINDQERLKGLVEYLGVEYGDRLVGTIRKQNPPHILSRFSNPDTVTEEMQRLGKAAWLEGG